MRSTTMATVVLSLATLAASAAAQPAPAPAPSSEPTKTINIASNPVGWLYGLYGLGVGVAVRDRIAVHADANYYTNDTDTGHDHGYELGLGVTLYADRAFSGALIEPGFRIRRLFQHCKGCGDFGEDLNTRIKAVGPEILIGWHWMIGPTLNVAVALGALYNLELRGASTDPPIELDGYFRIGFAL